MTQISIPKLGVTMEEATITSWLVEDGAPVTAGQALYLLESDKTEMEIESPVDGVLERIGEEGAVYDVGTVVAYIR